MLSRQFLNRFILTKQSIRCVTSLGILLKSERIKIPSKKSKVTSFRSLNTSTCQFCLAETTATATAAATDKVTPKETLFKRVLKKLGFNLTKKVYLLYQNIADQINYLQFFKSFNLPNTFNSWFLITELHVWMLLLRAMAEGSETNENGRFMRNCIVEAMWADVNIRAKKLGSSNPSLTRKQIGELSEQFQAALIAYDEGITLDDRVLAAALWRRFFGMNCNDYTKVEFILKYVRFHVNMLDGLSREDFLLKRRISWRGLHEFQAN